MLPPRLPPCKLHPSLGHDEHDDDDGDGHDDGGLDDGQGNRDGGDDDGDDDDDVEAMTISVMMMVIFVKSVKCLRM